jgi:putative transposase
MVAHEQEFSVKRMCSVLDVSHSGYYAWKIRPLSQRDQEDQFLLKKVSEIFVNSRGTYGGPRIQQALKREGCDYSRKRIARLMKIANLVPKKVAKWHPKTTKQAADAKFSPNLLNQNFTAENPNEKWVADITYIDTAEEWLYLAAILDLFSRRVVGWAMGDHINTNLVENAWNMALINRYPDEGLIHHSDRGSQYTSQLFMDRLEQVNSRSSMSDTGNCYDNAAMESFFATLKGECATYQFKTKAEARSTIFEYIEVWYNRMRLHSTLGYCSPVEFEHFLRQ